MTTHKRLALCFAVLAIATTAGAADWMEWRGPTASGTSNETGWSAAAIQKPSSVIWKVNVGKGHAATAVAGNRIYTLGSKLKGGKVTAEVVYCLDAEGGTTVWEYAYPAQHREYPGPGSTPVVADGTVYTVGRDGLIHALNAADGTVRWRRDLVGEGVAAANHWGFNGSALVDGRRLILNVGASGLALDRRNGKTLWSSAPEGNGHATPVRISIDGKDMVIIGTRALLHAVAPATGEVVWSHPWRADRDSAVSEAGLLLTGSLRGGGAALLDVSTNPPEEKWKATALGGAFMTGVVIDDHAFGFGRRGRAQPLQCVNTTSGEIVWSQDLGGWGALTAADGKLIIVDGDGDLIIAEANGQKYKELARTKLFSNIKRYESYPEGDPEACWTSPVLANGKLYVRSSFGQLACLKLKG